MASRADVLRLRIDVEGKQAERTMDRFTRKVQGSNKKIETSNKKTAASFKSMRVSMLGLTAGAAAVIGAAVAVKRLTDQAQKVTNLEKAFGVLQKRIGGAATTALPKLRSATRGLVSDMELMKQANSAVLLGIPVTEDAMAKLAGQAVTLGRAMGVDATRAMESMIVGIGRQSRLWLDNLGIIVDVTRANKDYAAALGVEVSALTDAQKKQAFLNATMAAADTAVAGLGAGTVTLGDEMASLTVTLDNVWSGFLSEANQVPQILRDIAGMTAEANKETASGLKVFAQFVRETLAANTPLGLYLLAREKSRVTQLNITSPNAPRSPAEGGLDPLAFFAGGLSLKEHRIAGFTASRAAAEARLAKLKDPKVLEAMLGGRRKAGAAARSDADILSQILAPTGEAGGLGGFAMPDFETLVGNLEPPPEVLSSWDEFGATIEHNLKDIGVSAAMQLGDSLVDAFFGADQSFSDFAENFLKQIARMIMQALILRAIESSGPHGAAIGAGYRGLNMRGFAKGGIVGARNGMMVTGGVPGRDSVPIMAQRGEAVLPPKLTSALMAMAEGGRGGGGGSTNVTIYAMDGADVRRVLENNPEAFAAGDRMARRRGAM